MREDDVIRATGLRRKAIDYYEVARLETSTNSENGHTDFSHNDMGRLKKVFVLRRIRLDTEDVGRLLADAAGAILQKLPTKNS